MSKSDSYPVQGPKDTRWFVIGFLLYCGLSCGCAMHRGATAQMNPAAMGGDSVQSSQGHGSASSAVQTVSYQEQVEGVPAELPTPMDTHQGQPLPEIELEPHFRPLNDEVIKHAMPNQESMNAQPMVGAPENSYRFSDPAGSGFAQPPPALPRGNQGGETWHGGYPQPGGPSRSTYNNGINVTGSEFRIPQRTATELMIDYKDDNEFLKGHVANLNTEITKLKQDLATETTAHESTKARLEQMVRQERQLREVIASLQVKVEDLEAANIEAKKEFDAALQQIESNLDAALMNSISGPAKTTSLSDQTP